MTVVAPLAQQMASAGFNRSKATTGHFRALRFRPRLELVAVALIVVLAIVTAHSIPAMNGHVPKPLVAALALAGAAILFNLTTEQLFLGWLVLAPLLQESAGKTRLGHLLSLGLYTAPPLLFGLKVLMTRGSRPRREWFDFVPGIYVAFIFASLIITARGELKSGLTGTLRGFYQTVALGALVYYVTTFWRGRPLSVVRICRLVLLASALQAVMCVVEFATHWNLWGDTSWQGGGDVRSIGTLTNPALTGAFIGAGIVIAVSILCWAGPVRLRKLSMAMIVVGIPGLYATKTRGPILATLIAVVVCMLLSSRSRYLCIGLIALVLSAGIAFWPQISSSSVYRNRVSQQTNVEVRLVLQTISIRLAEERPIVGWGYDSFDRVKSTVQVNSSTLPLSEVLASTSHDTYLTLLVEFGAIGLFIFLLPWAVVLRRSVRYARTAGSDTWFYASAIGSIAVIEITAATLDYRFYSFIPALPWMFLGLLRRQTSSEGTGPALAAAHVATP